MTAIDWTRPLVTNAGKPARVVSEPHKDGYYNVEAEWRDKKYGDYGLRVILNGRVYGLPYFVRNATPAEILAAPDVWPEWQDWARSRVQVTPSLLEAAALLKQPTRDWLTPETAIGARLPCGATVVRARHCSQGVAIWFDRLPVGGNPLIGRGDYSFRTDGSHAYCELPDLIPPPSVAAPQQDGVYVTREAWDAVVARMEASEAWRWRDLADALGIPPAKPKPAPWESAYEAWLAEQETCPTREKAVRWAVEWCVGQMNGTVFVCEEGSAKDIQRYVSEFRRRIMGDA